MSVTNINIPTAQSFILVDTRTGPNKVLFLPAASTIQGRYLSIKDYFGGATNSSMTISTTGLDRIDQRGIRYTLASSFGSVMLLSDGARSWNMLGLYEGADTAIPSVAIVSNVVIVGANSTLSYGDYIFYYFTTVGNTSITITNPDSTTINAFILGGGGGGGAWVGGGGGAGGLCMKNGAYSGSYTVTVGAGGNGGTDGGGAVGGNSQFSTFIGYGGGGGAYAFSAGASGGCGGGAGYGNNSGGATTQSSSASGGFGFAGGYAAPGPAGGGGGIGSAGVSNYTDLGISNQNGLNGGFGYGGASNSTFLDGRAYGGGGGGGTNGNDGTYMIGGFAFSGGGNGGIGAPIGTTGAAGYPGTANTGGGGGGGGNWNGGTARNPGGNGGSGIVILYHTGVSAQSIAKYSALFNTANNTALSIPTNTAFTLGTNNHTIEFWFYQTTRNTYDTLFRYGDNTPQWTSTSNYYFNIGNSQFLVILGNGSGGWELLIDGGTKPTLNTWNHYALVRNGTTFTLYINGTSRATATSSISIGTQSGSMVIGSSGSTGGSDGFTGYISNFRFVNGTAVYTSNFTPPTTPLTAIPNTQVLIQGLVDRSANAFTVTNNGGVTLSTSVSPFA